MNKGKDAQEQSTLTVIAGPNGSGKTTLTDELKRSNYTFENYINPDDIAKDLLKTTPSPSEKETYEANLQAQLISEQRRQDALENKESVSFETVMSHPSKLDFMQQAKDSGYTVNFHFVATESPAINIERVQDRVSKGGHDVPRDKIADRYHRVMQILPEAVTKSDLAVMYDNSKSGANSLEVVAVIQKGKEIKKLTDFTPHWVESNLVEKIDSRDKSYGPYKDKAEDFKKLSTEKLVQKYPQDEVIRSSLEALDKAYEYAEKQFKSSTTQEKFIESTRDRLAYYIEHGQKIIENKDIQKAEPIDINKETPTHATEEQERER